MATFFLATFVIGFALSVISLVLGVGGHSFGHDLHIGHGHDASHGNAAPLVNFGTITAFMTWFGGVGYLLLTYSTLVGTAAVVIAAASGVGGAAIVVAFMRKVLLRDQIPMRAMDYHVPGTLGRVTVTIPAGGTGEIVYTQAGARKTAAARDDSGAGIDRGAEVVVLRYERGVAHVRAWDELAEDRRQGEGKGAGR